MAQQIEAYQALGISHFMLWFLDFPSLDGLSLFATQVKPALRAFRDKIDPEAQGGAHLLGLRRLGVVCHGRFTRNGVANAILLAQRGAREDVVGRTHAALEAAGALRAKPPAASASAATVGGS